MSLAGRLLLLGGATAGRRALHFARVAVLVGSMVALVPVPASAASGRTVSGEYYGAVQVPGVTPITRVDDFGYGGVEFTLNQNDSFAKITVDDVTGDDVGGRFIFETADSRFIGKSEEFCGGTPRVLVPRNAGKLLVTLDALSCVGTAVQGTVSVVLQPATRTSGRKP